jgi:hypothetical protein
MKNEENRSQEMESQAERPFQKGNINFDFLQPETQSLESKKLEEESEAPAAGRSKRGIFFQRRKPIPLSFLRVARWVILFGASSITMIWSVLYGKSFFWLLLFPVFFLTMLGSVIMLALLLARPR